MNQRKGLENQPSQHDRFIEAARAAETDEDEAAFKAKLGVIARQKPKDAGASILEPSDKKKRGSPLVDISQELLARLIAGPIKRHVIVDEIGVPKGIRYILQRESRKLRSPYVVERRLRGQKHQVEYRLRPATIGETAGQVNEVDEFVE
jgi:hypothetical protein